MSTALTVQHKASSTIAMIRHWPAPRIIHCSADLQGPKIRTGTIEPPLMLHKKDILTIVMSKTYEHHGTKIGTTWTTMAEDVAIDDPVLFADGALSGTVTDVRFPDNAPAEVDIRIEVGGELKSRKGINLPASNIKAPALTPKDEGDLAVGVAAGVDYGPVLCAACSRYENVAGRLDELGQPNLPTIAKIEEPQGVDNIEEILDLASGIMVARGDLGVEIPIEHVPVVQRGIMAAANRKGKLVITATQMLESMTHHPFPTRAEVTDVANAIMDGTDAVMLSGETYTGDYPDITVQTMGRIAIQAEKANNTSSTIEDIQPLQGKYQCYSRSMLCGSTRSTTARRIHMVRTNSHSSL